MRKKVIDLIRHILGTIQATNENEKELIELLKMNNVSEWNDSEIDEYLEKCVNVFNLYPLLKELHLQDWKKKEVSKKEPVRMRVEDFNFDRYK